jgi:AcrR family transcriptional regulator
LTTLNKIKKPTPSRQEMQEDVRQRIIDTARKLYTLHSVDNVTFEDISKEANISRRTIYRYFASKKELIQTLFDEHAMTFLEKMSADLSQLSDDFFQLLEDYIVYLAINGPKAPGREVLYGKSKALQQGKFYFSSRLLLDNWKNIIALPFEKAVLRGEVRSDIQPEQLLEWIGRVVFSFVQFPKKEEELRQFLKTFVLPALKP